MRCKDLNEYKFSNHSGEPSEKLSKYLGKNILDLLKERGISIIFIHRYLLNSVLSYLEKLDQQNINGMRYDQWNLINERTIEDIRENVKRDLQKLLLASDIVGIKVEFSEELIYELLYTLITEPIYPATDVRAVIALDYDGSWSLENLKERITSKGIKVRTFLIELASMLYKVRQRFPDKGIFESPRLIDRVLVFVEPRMLPLDVVDMDSVKKRVRNKINRLFNLFIKYISYKIYYEYDKHDRLYDIVDKFYNYLKNEIGIKRFYKFQAEGICEILDSMIKLLESIVSGRTKDPIVKNGIILQAPTGSGKTEVFIIGILLIILAYKFALYVCDLLNDDVSPLVFIVYPRRALATDQLKRLVTYVYYINKSAREILKIKYPLVRISMSYTEVQNSDNYINAIKEKFNEWTNKNGFSTFFYIKIFKKINILYSLLYL